MNCDAKRPVIFFDWDGTLADSMDVCVGGIEEALRRIGLPPVDRAVIRRCNGPLYEECVHILGVPAPMHAEFLRLRTACETDVTPRLQRLYPGIPVMLRALSARADLAIVSNGRPEYLETSLALTGIRSFFVRAQARQPGKTKAQLLAGLLAELSPVHCALVGDCLGDIEAAHACGVPALAVRYGYGAPTDWQAAEDAVDAPSDIPAAALRLAEGTGRTAAG